MTGDVLIIHGGKDPETQITLPQIENLLTNYNISSDTHIIPNANHSFYSIKWKEEIYDIVEKWFKQRREL